MRTTRKRMPWRALRPLTTMLMLGLLAALLLAGGALAAGHEGPGKSAAKPGRPTAKLPKGTSATTLPTFTWSKARGATRYELRVYEGGDQLLEKSGIGQRSWTSRLALPTNVDLTWKVRGRNARGAGAWSRNLTFKIVPPSAEKAITAFGFQSLTPPVSGVIIETLHTIALTVPSGTDLSALVATFTTTGASVTISGTPQVSGVTANTFANPVTYMVSAADASTQAYVVTVTVAPGPTPTPSPSPTPTPTPTPSAAKAITAFSFQGLTPPVIGTIDEAAHTIALTVPFATNVTALVPTITQTGASVSPVGGMANNFTSPVTYTVTAADASTQAYVVTVAFAASPAKAITAFGFQSLIPPVVGTIQLTQGSGPQAIFLLVPSGTNLTNLVATFTTTGTSVKVGSTLQTSATTPNDFTSPVTYTVTAADSSTMDYVVTVTFALAIGDSYQGGKIAYILQNGDPGYDLIVQHGLIAAGADQTVTGIRWYNGQPYAATGATGTALGTGFSNTTTIMAIQGPIAISYAAGVARDYTGGGYTDWYLPSKDELNKLYLSKGAIGGFVSDNYWSSSEIDATFAWVQNFDNAYQDDYSKNNTERVRAVRRF